MQMRCLENIDAKLKKERFEKVCRLRGLIAHEVEETNELGETKLMASAAEGRYQLQSHCFQRFSRALTLPRI